MSGNNATQSELELEHPLDAVRLGGFLVGLLLGGVTGAGAMLLLAPQSGKRTRAKIQMKGDEVLDQANEIVEDAMAQARRRGRRIRTTVRKEADHLQQHGQDIFDEQMQRVSAIVETGKR
jgi:gas vesicle protein